MNKWTIIGIVEDQFEGAEANECIRMFNTIFSLEIPQDIAIVVWLKMPADQLSRVDLNFKPDGQTDPVAGWYAIKNLAVPTASRKCGPVLIDRRVRSEAAIRDPKRIKSFLNVVASDPAYAAKKNLLVTWGHGNPYGMFQISDVPETAREKMKMLSTGDLAGAIKATFGRARGPRIDVLIALNCNLNFFDSIHCLAKVGVGYLVAASNTFDFIGYNYSNILSRLFTDKDLKPEVLARVALDTINKGNQKTLRSSQLGDAAIYANDVSHAVEMGKLMNALGDALKKELPGNIENINKARDAASGTMAGFFFNVDFFQFVKGLAKAFGKGWQKDLLVKIGEKKKQLQIDRFIGDDLRKTGSFPLGFTVCLPTREQRLRLSFYKLYFRPESRFPSSFAKGSWSRFVNHYVDLLVKISDSTTDAGN